VVPAPVPVPVPVPVPAAAAGFAADVEEDEDVEKKAKDGLDLNSENLGALPAAAVSGMEGGSAGLKSEVGNELAMMVC
jgi:hypothetical protein